MTTTTGRLLLKKDFRNIGAVGLHCVHTRCKAYLKVPSPSDHCCTTVLKVQAPIHSSDVVSLRRLWYLPLYNRTSAEMSGLEKSKRIKWLLMVLQLMAVLKKRMVHSPGCVNGKTCARVTCTIAYSLLISMFLNTGGVVLLAVDLAQLNQTPSE